MLKLEKLLTDYLVAHQALTLPGFGHFSLSPAAAPLPDDKNPARLIGEIRFTPDPKADVPDSLIDYISTKAGKMRPLALSDLESYLEIGHQLLNISKPFSIEGIGTLLRNSGGQLEFVQGEAIIHGEEIMAARKPRASEKGDMHFEGNYLRARKGIGFSAQRLAITSLVVIGLGLIGWVAWYFYHQAFNEESPAQVVENTRQETDLPVQSAAYEIPAQNNQSIPDSSQHQPDSSTQAAAHPASPAPVPVTAASAAATGFDVVLEISKRNRAMRRYADLKEWGHKVNISPVDSLTFKLSIPIEAPLSDSTRHRDSLSRFFGKKVWIETH